MKDFALTEEDKEYIKTFDYLHTDLFGNILKDLPELRAAGVKVVMDFSIFSGNPEYNTDENFKNVDYAFLSYEKEDDYIREQDVYKRQRLSYGPVHRISFWTVCLTQIVQKSGMK